MDGKLKVFAPLTAADKAKCAARAAGDNLGSVLSIVGKVALAFVGVRTDSTNESVQIIHQSYMAEQDMAQTTLLTIDTVGMIAKYRTNENTVTLSGSGRRYTIVFQGSRDAQAFTKAFTKAMEAMIP